MKYLLAFLLASLLVAEPVVKVGVIAPQTGEVAPFASPMLKSMELALADLKPETRAKISVIYEDDAFVAKNSVSALNKLLMQDPPNVIVSFGSSTSKALSAITEPKAITLIAVASDASISAGKKHSFNFWVTPEEEANSLLPELARKNYKRIARVSVIHEGIQAVNKVLNKSFENKISVPVDEEMLAETKDFKSIITKIKSKEKELDAVMIILFPGQLAIFARQLRNSGVNLPIIGFETMDDPNEIAAAHGALKGAWYVTAAEPTDDLKNRLQKESPGASTYASANGYDIIKLLADAIESGKANNLSEYLKNLKDFSGSLGTYSASGDQRFTMPAMIKTVAN